MSRHTRTRQVTLATASVAALSVVFAGPAAASLWTKAGTAAGSGKAGSVGAVTVTVPSSTVTNGTVAVSWTSASAPSGASVTYVVDRKSGATYTAACTGTTPTSSLTCNDTGVAAGTYQYRVTAKVGTNWATASADSGSVTVSSAGTSLSINSFTTANSGHAVNVSGVAAYGTTGDAASVTVSYCKTNAFPCASSDLPSNPTSTASVNPTTGAWSVLSGNLGNSTATVYARATQTRTAGDLTSNVAGPVNNP
ncbi:MAG: hypothetical protein JWL77_7019 [Chthonomonadaceae bacterium]|nr:hypothetical protein [Chthonomonadaceae bacterium]